MRHILAVTAVFFFAFGGALANVVWEGPSYKWAFACDFENNDLGNEKVPPEQCGPSCESTAGCTHFVWTNYEGGTCWMKNGNVGKECAFFTGDYDMICGVV